MKYMLVLLVLRYHLSIFSKLLLIASLSSLNFGALAIDPHIFCRNSMMGIVCQTAGS